MIHLRDYQYKAVKKLIQHTNDLLELQTSKTIVFKAPTGSGKTVMAAEYLKDLVEHRADSRKFAFLWTAPRKLHEQSKDRLEVHYADSKALRCVYFEDLVDRQIHQNEILFLNWESINQADNIYIRENERDLNLSTILQNTRDAGLTVILIIDESHFASKSEISQGLIKMFDPKITIEVSATPQMQGDETVTVYPEQVISEGVIKKQISINPGFKNQIEKQRRDELIFTSEAAESTDEFVLRIALEKREHLATLLRQAGSNVNPLLLIQLPDKHEGESDLKEQIIPILKANHGISVDNGKLAIYLSEDKANLENITRNDNETEVMIFKQAIALGWDCPRASILVLFRALKSFTFSTQTLGRILRMPELKHYSEDELNIGYVFTNLGDMSILNDTADGYLTIQYSQRIKQYQKVNLPSVYLKRFREETRLAPKFISDFLNAANELELEKKIDLKSTQIEISLLTDGMLGDVDSHPDHLAETTGTIHREQNREEIQKAFDNFVIENLAPFFPETRSVGRVKDAIYRFFQIKYPMQYRYGDSKIHILVLNDANRQYIIDALNRAKDIYQQDLVKGRREVIKSIWNVPAFKTFNNRYVIRPMQKSVLQPYYEAADASQPEKEFAEYIDTTLGNVEWFYRNGESDSTSFAVQYKNNQGENTPFYVDWVIKFTDGRIGLFDTKQGIIAEIAQTRAEGLAAYIKAENAKGNNLFGGIVIKVDGSWRYNDSDVYVYHPGDLNQWKFLS